VHTLTYPSRALLRNTLPGNGKGKEFAYHQQTSETLNAKGFFAHPYHSWERGLNENTNGLIRQYSPKGREIGRLSDAEVNAIMDKLNNRPRKCLGFRTPNQVFNDQHSDVALES